MQTTMQTTAQTQRPLVLSYLGLRRSVGVIGILLPIALAVGRMVLEGRPGLLDSLSDYYYSSMRDVWVGSLWAIGVFFFSYRYSWQDDVAGDLAGICAIGVAILPKAPSQASSLQLLIGTAHSVLGVAALLIMAYFALVLFRKTDRRKPPTQQKRRRNRIYLLCGLLILACLALLALVQFQPVPISLEGLHPVFWLETLALWAFGLAWFVKGETLLKDK